MLKSYIAFDVETTGLNPLENEIIEIGALKVRDGKVAERFMEFIKPTTSISPVITSLTGITNDMVAQARPRCSVVADFLDFCEEDVLIGHNVSFDYSFMKCSAAADGLPFEKMGIDTLKIAQKVLKDLDSKSLGSLCDYYHIENKSAHRAKIFKPVQLTYKVKKPQPATPKQIAFLNNLIRKKQVKLQWNPGTITRSEASRMIDELLKG